jgi:hypothetical protein
MQSNGQAVGGISLLFSRELGGDVTFMTDPVSLLPEPLSSRRMFVAKAANVPD